MKICWEESASPKGWSVCGVEPTLFISSLKWSTVRVVPDPLPLALKYAPLPLISTQHLNGVWMVLLLAISVGACIKIMVVGHT